MIINFPGNCNNEASRWSFCIEFNEILRLWHNENCHGMTAQEADTWRKENFYPRSKLVMFARNEQIGIARVGGFWNPRVPYHVQDGVITYPSGLNQDNEGSRASFLFGLEVKAVNDIDLEAIRNAIVQAKEDAIDNSFWNPSLGSISGS